MSSQFSKEFIKALDDLSFELKKGGSLSVVGPSGSGKTTLLTLLAGLDQADQGQGLFRGTGRDAAAAAEEGPSVHALPMSLVHPSA